jgi:hypothetical protein
MIRINGFLCLELENVGTGTVVILVKRRTNVSDESGVFKRSLSLTDLVKS